MKFYRNGKKYLHVYDLRRTDGCKYRQEIELKILVESQPFNVFLSLNFHYYYTIDFFLL